MSNTVVKGKWRRSEYLKIKELGYKPDIISRSLMTVKEEFFNNTYSFLFKFFYKLIPSKIKRKVIFKIKGYKYEES